MKLAILLGAVTIGLFFIISGVADEYGTQVGQRFLERDTDYTAYALKNWVTSNKTDAHHYAIPVLFPLDLLFLLALSGFLLFGSVRCAQSIAPLKSWAWLFAILPAVYALADLLEDGLLARLLLAPDKITEGAVAFAKTVTAVKIKTAGVSIVQTVLIAAASLVAK